VLTNSVERRSQGAGSDRRHKKGVSLDSLWTMIQVGLFLITLPTGCAYRVSLSTKRALRDATRSACNVFTLLHHLAASACKLILMRPCRQWHSGLRTSPLNHYPRYLQERAFAERHFRAGL